MSEVALLQLIGFRWSASASLILLFIQGRVCPGDRLCRHRLGTVLDHRSKRAADGIAASGGRKIRHREYQDPDRYGSHRTKNIFQQRPVRPVPFHRAERIGAVSGFERHRRQTERGSLFIESLTQPQAYVYLIIRHEGCRRNIRRACRTSTRIRSVCPKMRFCRSLRSSANERRADLRQPV